MIPQNLVTLEKWKSRRMTAGTNILPVSEVTASAFRASVHMPEHAQWTLVKTKVAHGGRDLAVLDQECAVSCHASQREVRWIDGSDVPEIRTRIARSHCLISSCVFNAVGPDADKHGASSVAMRLIRCCLAVKRSYANCFNTPFSIHTASSLGSPSWVNPVPNRSGCPGTFCSVSRSSRI